MSVTGTPTTLQPFKDALANVFGVMLQCSLEEVETADTVDTPTGVSSAAVVGLRGSALWTLTLIVPEKTGAAIARRFLQVEEDLPESEIVDAVRELANMVAGGAKAILAKDRGEHITITLPTVVTGSDCHVDHPLEATTSSVTFSSEVGELWMRVAHFECSAELSTAEEGRAKERE